MVKMFGSICKGANILVVLLYLLACLIPFLPPQEFWYVAILGLVFPFILLAVLVFLLGWIIARSKWFVVSLAALVLSWQQLSVMAGLHVKSAFEMAKSTKTIRVLSWNLSSWGDTNKKRSRDLAYRPLMAELVISQQADVLCFQEFWDSNGHNNHDSIIPVFKEAGYQYSYFVKTIIEKGTIKTGVAILSKYPILDTGKFTFGKKDFAENLIYADILCNNNRVRVFTTHLQSVRFEQQEYNSLDKIKRTDKSGLKDSRTILGKLKRAYQFRGSQADLVQEKIKESPYPVIICGDFNDVPNSYTYFTIKGNLQDAFLKAAGGFGRTFQYISPTLRIDYILADKKFDVAQYNCVVSDYSDHYPVVADLLFKEK